MTTSTIPTNDTEAPLDPEERYPLELTLQLVGENGIDPLPSPTMICGLFPSKSDTADKSSTCCHTLAFFRRLATRARPTTPSTSAFLSRPQWSQDKETIEFYKDIITKLEAELAHKDTALQEAEAHIDALMNELVQCRANAVSEVSQSRDVLRTKEHRLEKLNTQALEIGQNRAIAVSEHGQMRAVLEVKDTLISRLTEDKLIVMKMLKEALDCVQQLRDEISIRDVLMQNFGQRFPTGAAAMENKRHAVIFQSSSEPISINAKERTKDFLSQFPDADMSTESPEHAPEIQCTTFGLQRAHATEAIAVIVHQRQPVGQSNGTVVVQYNTSKHRS
jgi:hypothetical protein